MKVKEYYGKYRQRLLGEDLVLSHERHALISSSKEEEERYRAELTEHLNKAVRDLLLEMSKEVSTMIETRNAKTNRAVASIILEVNDRWNRLADMLTEKDQVSVLNKDAFWKYWCSKIPELAPYKEHKSN